MKIIWNTNTLLLLLLAPALGAVDESHHEDHDFLRRSLAPPPTQSNECILTKMVVYGTSSGSDDDDEGWYCELHDNDRRHAGKRFVKIEGLNNNVLDFATSGSSTLLVPGAVISNGSLIVPTGASIPAFGKVEPRGPAGRHRKQSMHENNFNSNKQRELAPIANVHKVVAVRVKANDSTTTASLNVLSDEIFGTSGDPVNLRERISSCSYGEVLMEPFVGTTASGVAIANGVVEVNVNVNIKGRDKSSIADDVEKAVEAYLGKLSDQFDHVILCIPPGSGTWTAFATVGGWRSVFNDDMCLLADNQVHEVGHNLGLNHASEAGDTNPEYGDNTGNMGEGDYSDNPKLCYNPAKSWQLGWYSRRRIFLDFTTRGGFRGQLIGIDDYQNQNATTKYVHAKIFRPGSNLAYYVGFNLATGININTLEAQNLVTVQSQEASGNSWLVAKLGSGQNYAVPNFIGNKTLSIEVKSINMLATPPYADVDIYLGTFAECQVDLDCKQGNGCAVGRCQNGGVCVYDTSKCPGNFALKLNTDNFPEETSWQVEDLCKGQVVLTKGPYSSPNTLFNETATLGQSQFKFTLFDKFGDGLCCGNQGPTEASLTFDGFQIVTIRDDFGSSGSIVFGASSCQAPTPTLPPTPPPTPKPTVPPTPPPTLKPTVPPTPPPTLKPTVPPTPPPTLKPTVPPTPPPTPKPTVPPTPVPTPKPTVPLTPPPTLKPTVPPTLPPTLKPATLPPTLPPTLKPATVPPTLPPTLKPTVPPTPPPTIPPTPPPTPKPTVPPTSPPTPRPTVPPTQAPVAPVNSSNLFVLELKTDNYPEDTTWQIKDVCKGGTVVLSGGPYTASNTVFRETGTLGSSKYALYVNDLYGDGLCCGANGATYFSVTFNGASIASNVTFSDDWKVIPFGQSCPSNKLSLQYQGDNLGSASPLSECGGDCDNDGECAGDLVCFERSDLTPVPGCSGSGTSGQDYCYKHYGTYGPLKAIANDPTIPLGPCEGDCDTDADCRAGLLCYQRGTGQVPGCDGVGYDTWDFCYDPTQGMTS